MKNAIKLKGRWPQIKRVNEYENDCKKLEKRKSCTLVEYRLDGRGDRSMCSCYLRIYGRRFFGCMVARSDYKNCYAHFLLLFSAVFAG